MWFLWSWVLFGRIIGYKEEVDRLKGDRLRVNSLRGLTLKVIRVFPQRTTVTPTDELVFVGIGPNMFDEADAVHVSVSFTWDIPAAEKLAREWEIVAPVTVGGPAYNDPGGEFVPGRYVRKGYTITSRGCPNNCWFCKVWQHEGRTVRELKINDGWNLLDNNILACSRDHQTAVYEMLLKQPEKPRFSGGLEAARFTAWNAEWLARLKPDYSYFAWDTPDDYEPLENAAGLLRSAGLLRNHKIGCYVLIGYPYDSFSAAEDRLVKTVQLGYFPQAMLFNRGNDRENVKQWRRFQRVWANKVIVGHKMKQYGRIG